MYQSQEYKNNKGFKESGDFNLKLQQEKYNKWICHILGKYGYGKGENNIIRLSLLEIEQVLGQPCNEKHIEEVLDELNEFIEAALHLSIITNDNNGIKKQICLFVSAGEDYQSYFFEMNKELKSMMSINP